MTFQDAALDALQGVFEAGDTITFTPASTGVGVEVLAIAVAPEADFDVSGFQTRHAGGTLTVEIRVSDIATVLPGDLIAWNGETYKVKGDPLRADPQRLVWTIECARVG